MSNIQIGPILVLHDSAFIDQDAKKRDGAGDYLFDGDDERQASFMRGGQLEDGDSEVKKDKKCTEPASDTDPQIKPMDMFYRDLTGWDTVFLSKLATTLQLPPKKTGAGNNLCSGGGNEFGAKTTSTSKSDGLLVKKEGDDSGNKKK